MKRPDEMTLLDELEAHVAHEARAMQVATAHGYSSIRDFANSIGYADADTTAPPAEYVLAWWRVRRTDEYYRAQQLAARDVHQRDAIARRWAEAVAYDERMMGA